MLNDHGGATPLSSAVQTDHPSLEVFELLVFHCPEACLILNNRNDSPYDVVVEWGAGVIEVVALMQATTINALIAFLVCVQQTLITVPPTALAHIRQSLEDIFKEGSSMSYMSGNQAIRQTLTIHETLKTLLRNDELQQLLTEEDTQDLIRGVYPMIQSGRNHIRQDDSKHHMCIIQSVIDAPDFMYLHLRNNPTLCDRSTFGTIIQQQQHDESESAINAAEQNAEPLASNDAIPEAEAETDRDDNSRPTRKRKAPNYLYY
jgi:hypothetical protein